jgi:hypothetical protein
MSDYVEQYLDTVAKSQEAALSAVKAWGESVQQAWEAAVADVPRFAEGQMPTPVEVVDATFDGLGRVLAVQRDFYRSMAEAYAPLVERATAEAEAAAAKSAPRAKKAS